MVGQTTAVRPYPRAAESGARAKFNLCEIPYTYTPYLSLSLSLSDHVSDARRARPLRQNDPKKTGAQLFRPSGAVNPVVPPDAMNPLSRAPLQRPGAALAASASLVSACSTVTVVCQSSPPLS